MDYIKHQSLRTNVPSLHKQDANYYEHYGKSVQRTCLLIALILSLIILILSVAALIIDFAVESSWFSDSFSNFTSGVNINSTNRYGLWRLCIFNNGTCVSWFTTESLISVYIEQRLNQARAAINGWQALEIVYLFFDASTLIICCIGLINYPWHKNVHYYFILLSVFCAWPGTFVGIAGLFVFGFAVYNVSVQPRSLDWCFYINIAAVALSLIAAILLTIYISFAERPTKKTKANSQFAGVMDDFKGFEPTYNDTTSSPSRLGTVHQRSPAKYNITGIPPVDAYTDYTMNTDYRDQLSNYRVQQTTGQYGSSGFLPGSPINTMSHEYRPPYQPQTHWDPRREPVDDYVYNEFYRSPRYNPILQLNNEPQLQFYNGHDTYRENMNRNYLPRRDYYSTQGTYPTGTSYYPPSNEYLTSNV